MKSSRSIKKGEPRCMRGGRQAAEKASYASLRSIDFASTYKKSTPPLIDLRAPRLRGLFEQPPNSFFSEKARKRGAHEMFCRQVSVSILFTSVSRVFSSNAGNFA